MSQNLSQTQTQDTEEVLPILIPSLDLSVNVSVAFNLVPALMINGIRFIAHAVSKYGTPLARQSLLEFVKEADKQIPLIRKVENGVKHYYTMWIDDDIIINTDNLPEILECIKKRENCVWNYPLTDREVVNEEKGVYGLGLALVWIPENFKFKSGWIDEFQKYMSEDVYLFHKLNIKPKLAGKVPHFKKIILNL